MPRIAAVIFLTLAITWPGHADDRKLLPVSEQPLPEKLPAWVHPLASAMPKTVAAMLELDYLHRAQSPLDPKLRAKMRWVAARSNRSPYAEAYALADMKRAGATEAEMASLPAGSRQWRPEERAAPVIARKLTEAAYKVTDEDVLELREIYGDAKVVAMVQLLAYSNFQDRLLHSLGITAEDGGPLPPLKIQFRKPFAGAADAPPRAKPTPVRDGPPGRVVDAEWKKLDFDYLKNQMEGQKARQPRIPVPPFESIRKYMPPNYPKDKEVKIRWSLVCTGYQPELAKGWSLCTSAFGQESKQDRVFEESLFWVVTRSLQCFY